jgi:hypothetical protein
MGKVNVNKTNQRSDSFHDFTKGHKPPIYHLGTREKSSREENKFKRWREYLLDITSASGCHGAGFY